MGSCCCDHRSECISNNWFCLRCPTSTGRVVPNRNQVYEISSDISVYYHRSDLRSQEKHTTLHASRIIEKNRVWQSLPNACRSYASGICGAFTAVNMFGATKLFPWFVHILGFHGTFWMYGLVMLVEVACLIRLVSKEGLKVVTKAGLVFPLVSWGNWNCKHILKIS